MSPAPTPPLRATGLQTRADELVPTATLPGPTEGMSSLSGNAAWILLGNLVNAACQWVILVVLTRQGSHHQLGEFTFALAVTAPVMLFAGMNLRALQVTDALSAFTFGHYLALRLLSILVALLVIIVIAVLTTTTLAERFVILAMAGAKGIEALSDIVHGCFQSRERMRIISHALTARGLLGVTAVSVIFLLTHSVLAATLALAGAWAVVFLGYECPQVRRLLRTSPAPTAAAGSTSGTARGDDQLAPRWEGRMLLRLAQLSLPMGVAALMLSLNATIPVYVVKFRLGLDGVAVFSAIAYLMVAGNLLVSALGTTASPRLARLLSAGDGPGYARLLGLLVAGCAGVGLCGWVLCLSAGRHVLVLLYGPSFATYGGFLSVMALASMLLFTASGFGFGVTAARRLRVQVPIAAAACLVCLGACLILVPRLGLIGAALGMLVMAAALCASYGVVAWRVVRATSHPGASALADPTPGSVEPRPTTPASESAERPVLGHPPHE